MSYKRPGPPRRRPTLELHSSPEEWIGGRLPAPDYGAKDAAVRPDLVIWICRGDILRVELVRPDAPAAVVGEQLRQAMRSPMFGPPRRPQRIRIADPALVDGVRAVVADGTPIDVGPTPELERLHEALGCYLYHGDGVEPSYLQQGRVQPATMAGLFRAAAALFREEPWRIFPTDMDILLLDIPALGLTERCVSIIGQLGEGHGFLLFDSVAGQRAVQALGLSADPAGAAPAPLGTGIFALNFERGADIPPLMRREIVRHEWEVAATNAYPHLFLMDPDQVERPCLEADVVRAFAVTAALQRFVAAHRPSLRDSYGRPGGARGAIDHRGASRFAIEGRFVLDEVPGAPEARVRAPHPEAQLLHDEGLDEGWEYGLKLVEAFLRSEEEAGRERAWLGRARRVCEALLEFKLDHLMEEVEAWTATQVEEFLLRYFPGAVVVEDAVIGVVPEVLQAFFAYLLEVGFVSERTALAIRRRIAAREATFQRRARDPQRFGLGRPLLRELRRCGVDARDAQTIETLLQQALRDAPPPRRRR